MSHIKRKAARPASAALVLLALLAACLGLAACGSSSSKTTTTTPAVTGASGATGARARFGALRECLQRNGITLPQRTPGQRRPGGGAGGFFGGGEGARLPNGVTRAQMQAALRKCGAANRGLGLTRIDTPAFKQALEKFVGCMRENGIDLPAPNTSGNGPVFNSSKLNTTSAKFRAAEQKCRAELPTPVRPGGPSGASGAPPPGGP
jgi:hypothetical protein